MLLQLLFSFLLMTLIVTPPVKLAAQFAGADDASWLGALKAAAIYSGVALLLTFTGSGGLLTLWAILSPLLYYILLRVPAEMFLVFTVAMVVLNMVIRTLLMALLTA